MGLDGGSNAQSAAGKKAKKRKSKSMQKHSADAAATENVVVVPKRDFQSDLKVYLEAWKARESGSGWKFNKVLQSWAIMHALNRQLIDKELFKLLCPYLATVMGVQRDRFIEVVEGVIEGGEQATEEEGEAVRPCYNRAIKLRTIMEESN